jgi:hypothetical protein
MILMSDWYTIKTLVILFWKVHAVKKRLKSKIWHIRRYWEYLFFSVSITHQDHSAQFFFLKVQILKFHPFIQNLSIVNIMIINMQHIFLKGNHQNQMSNRICKNKNRHQFLDTGASCLYFVSEWLLFNSAILLVYHGKKLIFNEMMRSTLY